MQRNHTISTQFSCFLYLCISKWTQFKRNTHSSPRMQESGCSLGKNKWSYKISTEIPLAFKATQWYQGNNQSVWFFCNQEKNNRNLGLVFVSLILKINEKKPFSHFCYYFFCYVNTRLRSYWLVSFSWVPFMNIWAQKLCIHVLHSALFEMYLNFPFFEKTTTI